MGAFAKLGKMEAKGALVMAFVIDQITSHFADVVGDYGDSEGAGGQPGGGDEDEGGGGDEEDEERRDDDDEDGDEGEGGREDL